MKEIVIKKLYLVIRPMMKDTSMPQFYYTFAENEQEAQHKVEIKWGTYDPNTQVKEITNEELDDLVVATDYFG